jgi:hypothetical protein
VLHHDDATALHFSFAKPSEVKIIGSFLLRTVAKPVLNVDVAIEIPPVRVLFWVHMRIWLLSWWFVDMLASIGLFQRTRLFESHLQ